MRLTLAHCLCVLIGTFAEISPGLSQVTMPQEYLDAMLKPAPIPKYNWRFAPEQRQSGRCNMQRVDLVRESDHEKQTYRTLLGSHAKGETAREILIQLDRLAVDADGAVRAYHPEDPTGTGQCERVGSGQATSFRGICALDHIANAGIRLFKRSKQIQPFAREKSTDGDRSDRTVQNPEFSDAWNVMWPLIKARKPIFVDLKRQVGVRRANEIKQRFFFSEANDLAAAFKPSNIPFDGHYPCMRSGGSGYFLTATSDRSQRVQMRSTHCDASRYLDASRIAFFVVPLGLFPKVNIGDVAVGFAKTNDGYRMAVGVVGDFGPPNKLGEASIAFNQLLMNQVEPPMNVKDVERLDIDLVEERGKSGIQRIAVLILGNTAAQFRNNYSAHNIERVSRAALREWNGAGDVTGRVADCLSSLPRNDSELSAPSLVQ